MIYLWENEPNPYDIFFWIPSFPIAQQVYSQWFTQNMLSEKAEQEEVKQAIIWKYRELFNKRVSDLLNFVGPKTETERLQYLSGVGVGGALTQITGYVSLINGCTFWQPLGSGCKWL